MVYVARAPIRSMVYVTMVYVAMDFTSLDTSLQSVWFKNIGVIQNMLVLKLTVLF